MPKIADFATQVLDLVAYELEIPREQILSRSRNTEAVDARHVTAMILFKSGIYVSRIAGILHVSPRYVQYIVTDFENRMLSNRPLRVAYERALSKLVYGPEL